MRSQGAKRPRGADLLLQEGAHVGEVGIGVGWRWIFARVELDRVRHHAERTIREVGQEVEVDKSTRAPSARLATSTSLAT
jgi:hypothetical protein